MLATMPAWRKRYAILSVLMVGMTVSSIDRVAMSVAIPYIATDLHFSATAMGTVMSVFFASYAFSQIPGGLLANRFGVRKVAAIAMIWWSLFTGLTGAAATFLQLLIARLVFGLGEGVFPPCCFAAIAIWFPRKERATANAIMFSAILLGGALSPLIVVEILARYGWRSVFYILLIPGVITALLFWACISDRPSDSKYITSEELQEIEGGELGADQEDASKVRLMDILFQANVMKYFLIYFSFDLAYWGFTAWLPTYLVRVRGFSLMNMGLLASLPSLTGAIGCLVGGWVSDRFFSRSRRIPIIGTQLIAAGFLYLVFSASSTRSLIIYQGLGGFFLMAFFGVFWALPMTTVPTRQVGIVGGLINMAGQIAAFIAPLLIGLLVDASSGAFGATFAFLIVCLLVSSLLIFTVPTKGAHDPVIAAH